MGGAFIERMAGLVVLALCAAVRIWDPAQVASVRDRSFDLLQILRPSQNAERPAVIVDIDDDSLKKLGQWPWPRTLIARLIERLAASGAVAVGFDVIFAEPDRNSPAEYAAAMPELPQAVREALRALPNNDQKLAETFARLPVVLPLAFTRQHSPEPSVARKPPVAIQGAIGTDTRAFMIGTNFVLSNIAVLQRAAAGTGLITYYPEADGIVRRVPAIYRVGQDVYPSLAVELIRVATGGGTLLVRAGRDGLESIVFTGPGGSGIAVPTDRRGRMWVRYSRHDPKRFVSAADVLEGKVPRAQIEGRLVLVGTSATALQDIKSTPLEAQMPGVEVHAQLIENILFKDHIFRPFYADAFEFFLAIVLALILAALLPRLGASRTLVSGLSLAGMVMGGAWLLFISEGLLFDITFPLATFFLVFLVLTFFNYFREEHQRRAVRTAFGRYLSPALVARLAADPAQLRLGGEMRPMTLLFSDIRGFTGISEKLDAARLTAFMNRYLTPMTDAILASGGTVDKYIGDAIMAFWNAPLDDPRHAAHACDAALAMMDRLRALNVELAREAETTGQGAIPIAIGIGINSAVCCVGNMGSQQRFDYSVLGDGVNLAARLEGQTKTYTMPIILGEDTAALAPEYALLEVDLVRVKGKTKPVRVYALMGDAEHARSEPFRKLTDLQQKHLAAYRARAWDAAFLALTELRAAGGDEIAGLTALYEKRIDYLRASPPAAHWEGIYIAEEK